MNWQAAEKFRHLCSRVAQRFNVYQRIRFASALIAALFGGLFEQPAGCAGSVLRLPTPYVFLSLEVFLNTILVMMAAIGSRCRRIVSLQELAEGGFFF
jgi:hypothetical protein